MLPHGVLACCNTCGPDRDACCPVLLGSSCRTLLSNRGVESCRWWQRLDVAPFLVLYALWAVQALELVWKEGNQRWSLVQLVTTGLVAIHVSGGHSLCRCWRPAVSC